MRALFAHIKTLVSKLTASGFFHIFGSTAINKIVVFASGLILVRILSKAEYGVYTYANNIYSFFVIATGFSMTTAVLQCCSESINGQKKRRLFTEATKIAVGFNILLSIAIVIVSFFITLPIEGANGLLLAMAPLPIISIIPELQRTYLRTELKNKEYSYSTTLTTILTYLFACILSLCFGSYGLVFSHYVSGIVMILVLSLIWKVNVNFRSERCKREEKKSLISIAGISLLNNGMSKLLYIADVFIIGLVIPNEEIIASYKIATTIPTALLFIPAALVVYIYPFFAKNKNNREWLLRNYKRTVLGMGVLNALITVILLAFAPFIITLLFGKQYNDAVEIFRVLCVGYFINGTFRTISGNLLVTQRKLKFNFWESLIVSVVNIALDYILIKQYGSMGAAITTVSMTALSAIINTPYLIHTLKHVGGESK